MHFIVSDRPYADKLKSEFEYKFSDLVEKLMETDDVAALNGIPSESKALL